MRQKLNIQLRIEQRVDLRKGISPDRPGPLHDDASIAPAAVERLVGQHLIGGAAREQQANDKGAPLAPN